MYKSLFIFSSIIVVLFMYTETNSQSRLVRGKADSPRERNRETGEWSKGYGFEDCREVCRSEGHRPIISGTYNETDADLYTCHIRMKGWRPGYNTEGERECRVGLGDNSRSDTNKYCLCKSPPVMGNWIKGYGYGDCDKICNDEGYHPVISGLLEDNKDEYYVCSINYKSRGWRSGANIQGARDCFSGSGGSEAPHSNNKKCLCTDK